MTGSPPGEVKDANMLGASRMGIDTLQEAVVIMRKECHVCRSEGFDALARVRLSRAERSVVATLYHVASDILGIDGAGLSDVAWDQLKLSEGDLVTASGWCHVCPVAS